MERVGGGWRTKETNLDEMTCFGGVKSEELGFSVPSPLQHVRLLRPKPCSPGPPTHFCINPTAHQQAGRTDSRSEKDKWWRGGKKREGGIWFNHSQTASKSILRTSKAHFKFILGTKNLPPLGHFSESDYNMNLIEIVEVKTKLTLQSRECKKKKKKKGSGLGRLDGMWGLGLGGSSKRATWFLRGSAWLVKHSYHFVCLKSGSTRSSGEVEGMWGGGMRGLAAVVVGGGVSVCSSFEG